MRPEREAFVDWARRNGVKEAPTTRRTRARTGRTTKASEGCERVESSGGLGGLSRRNGPPKRNGIGKSPLSRGPGTNHRDVAKF